MINGIERVCDGIAFTCSTFGTLFAKVAKENQFNPGRKKKAHTHNRQLVICIHVRADDNKGLELKFTDLSFCRTSDLLSKYRGTICDFTSDHCIAKSGYSFGFEFDNLFRFWVSYSFS